MDIQHSLGFSFHKKEPQILHRIGGSIYYFMGVMR